jgi:predicted aminopeptidase
MPRGGCLFLLQVFFVASIAGCSPGYVVRAAYEQSKILLARRPIAEVIKDPATTQEDREKLSLVLAARTFATDIGLDPGEAFTQFSDIGKDTLAWVVMASRKDSFSMHTWWFPIVGTVPYKGFFDQQDALLQAKALEQEGYESSVRGTEAFSTLGWFNDPLLSTTLKNTPTRIVNTVIHETVHSTVWIPGHVAFNESLANFVGSRAAIDFFKGRRRGDAAALASKPSADDTVLQSEREHKFTLEFADCVSEAFDKLNTLYGRGDLTSEQKVSERQQVFDQVMEPFRVRYPAVTALRTLNNAELLQSTIYMTKLRLFEQLYASVQEKWPEFFGRVVELKGRLERGESNDPFELLGAMANG